MTVIRILRKAQSGIYGLIDRSRYPGHPLVSRSTIKNSSLVDPLATVRNSSINGEVEIGAKTKILSSAITGNIRVGENSKLSEVLIDGDVSIGRWTTINGPNCNIYAWVNSVTIGCFCSIARNVSIQEYNHRLDRISTYFFAKNVFGENQHQDIESKGKISIGNDVWIGAGAVILSGAQISDGVVVGANTVITGYVPPYAVVVGSPPTVVKYRFPEHLIERLLELKWWDWADEKILRNRHLFLGAFDEHLLDKIV